MSPRYAWPVFAVALLVALVACTSEGGRNAPDPTPPGTAPDAGPPSPSPHATSAADPEMEQRIESVRSALDQGLDVNQADEDGRTLLMMAAFDGHTDVVRLLLDHGAAPDQRDTVGRTALMYASTGPFPETVELLLDRGAAVDHADSHEGWTALMFAAGEGLEPVVELLLLRGADPTLRDGDGDTAADHARTRGHPAVARMIDEAGRGR